MNITYLFGAGASAGNQQLLKDLLNNDKDGGDPEGIPVVKGVSTF